MEVKKIFLYILREFLLKTISFLICLQTLATLFVNGSFVLPMVVCLKEPWKYIVFAIIMNAIEAIILMLPNIIELLPRRNYGDFLEEVIENIESMDSTADYLKATQTMFILIAVIFSAMYLIFSILWDFVEV